MPIQIYVHDGGVLTNAATVQGVAVPALTKRVITAAALTNTTNAAVAASVYLVISGDGPNSSNTLISGRVVAPGETYLCPELINQGLNAGGTVRAFGEGLSFKYSAKDVING